jgi:myo-inositol-1(or 4)-monophosphatase
MMPTFADDLDLLRAAAREAATIAMRYFGRALQVSFKGDASPVSEADLAIDRHLQVMLTGARPDYGWLSEESADDGSRLTAKRCFIVDPIDGTRAFIGETPEWCISIGLVEDGRPVAGVLHCPVSGDVYAASAGGGAFRNARQLGGGSDARYGMERRFAAPPGALRKLESALGQFTRHPYVPSLALRLAYVADATIDGTLVKPRAAFWDVAAADIILAEAGGKLVSPEGAMIDYAAPGVTLGAMVAARPPHFDSLLAIVPAVMMG